MSFPALAPFESTNFGPRRFSIRSSISLMCLGISFFSNNRAVRVSPWKKDSP